LPSPQASIPQASTGSVYFSLQNGRSIQKPQKSVLARKSARNWADSYIFSSQIKKISRATGFLDSTGSQKN
jgi:hypothetical protein